jgi:hypothetical protein
MERLAELVDPAERVRYCSSMEDGRAFRPEIFQNEVGFSGVIIHPHEQVCSVYVIVGAVLVCGSKYKANGMSGQFLASRIVGDVCMGKRDGSCSHNPDVLLVRAAEVVGVEIPLTIAKAGCD